MCQQTVTTWQHTGALTIRLDCVRGVRNYIYKNTLIVPQRLSHGSKCAGLLVPDSCAQSFKTPTAGEPHSPYKSERDCCSQSISVMYQMQQTFLLVILVVVVTSINTATANSHQPDQSGECAWQDRAPGSADSTPQQSTGMSALVLGGTGAVGEV